MTVRQSVPPVRPSISVSVSGWAPLQPSGSFSNDAVRHPIIPPLPLPDSEAAASRKCSSRDRLEKIKNKK